MACSFQSAADLRPGQLIRHSWGYGMTLNDFAVILETTGKSVIAQRIGSTWVSGEPGFTGRVKANPADKFGKPFRLFIRPSSSERFFLRGSYPYCEGREDKQLGNFYPTTADEEHYENHMD